MLNYSVILLYVYFKEKKLLKCKVKKDVIYVFNLLSNIFNT